MRYWLAIIALVWTATAANTLGQASPDLPRLISRADLDYDTPASRSEEGMPIGNGRMGSLVWTTPSMMRFQINRADVFAVDSTTTSFPRTHSDYASGCAFVDVVVPGISEDPFGVPGFHQHLSVYDGVMSLEGKGVTFRAMALQDHDVFAIEVDEQREIAQPIAVDLRMLRYASRMIRGQSFPATNPHSNTIATGAHMATSALEICDNGMVLIQHFREGAFYNASGVAIAIVGRDAKAEYANETTVRLLAAPGKGKFTILIASSSSFDRNEDVVALAIKQLQAASDKSFEEHLAANRKWWEAFWDRGYIDLHSADGEAAFVAQNYAYFLYVMASCSRGPYPARFGGMLWYSNGDLRAWGSQYWWANQSCYYNGLPASNHFELLDPTFEMCTKMYDACALAAKQQWGSAGIWIPETGFFNGPAKLPDDIAEEMQQLYLLKKPWSERSEKFFRYASAQQSFNSRWNWISQDGHYELGQWVLQDKGAAPFGHVTHIFGTTAKIAYLYWQKYEYTLDEKWLRERAYPMLKGAVEFYRNFPNMTLDADGKYHIHHTNSNEPAWGVRDSDEDMSALHGLLPVAIRASEILNVDEDLRGKWKDFLAKLAPIPTSDNPEALKSEDYTGPRVFVKGLKPAAKAGGLLPDGNTLPEWNFDLIGVNSTDAELMQTANNTLDAFFRRGVNKETRIGTLSRLAIAAAQMGRADAVKYLIPNQVQHNERPTAQGVEVFRNRMALREGPGATECQRLGRAAEALHNALLQSAPPTPGGEPLIRVFPAWPKDWDASFKLASRGACTISSAFKDGKVQYVDVDAQKGATLNIVNPWTNTRMTLKTEAGRRYHLTPESN